MSDPHDADRLKSLEAKIAALKAPTEVKHHSEEHYSQAQLAWRMVIELVAGLGIGIDNIEIHTAKDVVAELAA